jgi:hypothetical protein
VVRAVLSDSDEDLTPQEQDSFAAVRGSLKAGELDQLHFATKLLALDLQYHELGGLYDRLHDAGRMKDVILTATDIEQSSRTPPAGGRAAQRGAWIRQHREQDWQGDWQYLWQTSSGQCLDLRDPFSPEARPTQLSLPPDREAREVDVLELLRATTNPSA